MREKPEWLDKDAAELWDSLVALPWVLDEDIPAVSVLVQSWMLRREVFLLLRHDPANKDLRVSYASYTAEVIKLLGKFGMTSGDRASRDLGEAGDSYEDLRSKFLR